MFPTSFQTDRLILRPITRGDANAVFHSYAQDPTVSRFMTWMPHNDVAETDDYLAACLASTSSSTYAIIARNDGKLCGAFELRQEGPYRVGFGYVLARSHWGQGLMTEVLTDVTAWALTQPRIVRFGDVCDVDNIASAQVMRKAGFVCEGVLRRYAVHPNISAEPRDCLSFATVR